jgi:hypothetical protein
MRDVTYARPDKALSSLGSSVRVVTVENKLRLYEPKETGARLAPAFRPDDEVVLPHHMAAVQGTPQVYGIADPLDFTTGPLKAS